MTEIELWIADAGKELNHDFVKLSQEESTNIVSRAKEKFVLDDPRSWWMSLRLPYKRYSVLEKAINDLMPGTIEKVWFIPETEEECMPVYELSPSEIQMLRENCPPFEYYVIPKTMKWIMIENDHDEFILSGDT